MFYDSLVLSGAVVQPLKLAWRGAWHWEGWRACLHGCHFSLTGYCYFTGPRMILGRPRRRRKGTTIRTRDNRNVQPAMLIKGPVYVMRARPNNSSLDNSQRNNDFGVTRGWTFRQASFIYEKFQVEHVDWNIRPFKLCSLLLNWFIWRFRRYLIEDSLEWTYVLKLRLNMEL